MPVWLIALGVFLVLYAAALVLLFAAGRKSDANSWARFIPDCLILVKRLVSDPRVERTYKVMLIALIAYLAMPFDLVPDFLPVIGLFDDVIIVFLVLRTVVRGVSPRVIAESWPGNSQSLDMVLSITRSSG